MVQGIATIMTLAPIIPMLVIHDPADARSIVPKRSSPVALQSDQGGRRARFPGRGGCICP